MSIRIESGRAHECQFGKSKGQQAMALAMIYPEPEKGGRGKKSQNSLETKTFSYARLSQARAVLRHSQELAESVLRGSKSLDEPKQQLTSGFSELRLHAWSRKLLKTRLTAVHLEVQDFPDT